MASVTAGDVREMLASYWAPGQQGASLEEIAKAAKKLKKEERGMLRLSIPRTTGTTGERCEVLRELFTELG